MRKIHKMGIVGFGYMGRFHLDKANKTDGLEVVAAFDTDKARIEEAERAGLKGCQTLEELLSIKEIEIVVIATPNDSHRDIAICALNAGKNVLCEKPAAMNLNETIEIVTAAKKNKRFFTVHHNRRWDRDFLSVKRLLEEGTIGEYTTINSGTLGQRGVCFGWRAEPEHGGGMLYDWAPHLIDQILQLYPDNKVTRLFCRKESILTPAVDDFFEIKMFLDNGVCANLTVGTFALQSVPRWFVYGDKGTYMLTGFSPDEGGLARIRKDVKGFESVHGKKNLGPSRTMAPLAPEQIENLPLIDVADYNMSYYENIFMSLEGKEEPNVSHRDVLRNMQLLDAAFESANKYQFIELDV